MRVLGIDPGSRKTGWGVVEEIGGDLRELAAGVAASGRGEIGGRLAAIFEQVEKILDQWNPDVVALERAFVGRNVASALRLGEVRGAILAGAGRRGLRVFDYPPATVKVSVAGAGAATKEMVAAGVAALLGTKKAPGDAADALAVAICHARHDQFSRRLKSATVVAGSTRRGVRVARGAR